MGSRSIFIRPSGLVVGEDMLEVFQESFRSGFLPQSCRRAVITLLPKKGDLQDLKNWRPVSLLCCRDYKVLSKALALRLREAMAEVVHVDQTYCVPGRLAVGGPPSNLLSRVQAILVNFFWDRLHWLPQAVLFLPKEEGGQGLVHLASRGLDGARWAGPTGDSGVGSWSGVEIAEERRSTAGSLESLSGRDRSVACWESTAVVVKLPPVLTTLSPPSSFCPSSNQQGEVNLKEAKGKVLSALMVRCLNRQKLQHQVPTTLESSPVPGDEELNLRLHVRVEDFDYVIFATSAAMKCFGCGKEGHTVRACPDRGEPAPPGVGGASGAAWTGPGPPIIAVPGSERSGVTSWPGQSGVREQVELNGSAVDNNAQTGAEEKSNSEDEHTLNVTRDITRSIKDLETGIVELEKMSESTGDRGYIEILKSKKMALASLLDVKVQGALVRSRVQNITEMDAPSSFFLWP
ncbi:hypothetical protein L3Q82_000910 [Scortum barcoo]|uniref:Uncharacterized protein n=1 Tax=Scortum barcoo TaxID=214431 RepID=A0ACB8WA65_9TELE|nr:hypothetical protein L3Q82_000910 [Scortum barcoo]